MIGKSTRVFRLFAKTFLSIAFLFSVALPSLAQGNYPERLVTIIVPFGPGGASDVLARLVASQLFRDKKTTVIVENKPGASGRIAAEYVAKQSAGDGYRLMVTGNGLISVAKAIYSDLRYDAVDDFVPISTIADLNNFFVAVPAGHPAKSLEELREWVKANPDKANYATSAPSYTISSEQFKMSTGIKAEPITYRSGSEAVLSLLRGETTFALIEPSTSLSLIQSGQIRALAVTGSSRVEGLPKIPTLKELGYDFQMRNWVGLFAPVGTPKEIISTLENEMKKILKIPEVAEKIKGMGFDVGGISSEEFTQRVRQETKDYSQTVKAANLKFEE